jgi:hypothetical protein
VAAEQADHDACEAALARLEQKHAAIATNFSMYPRATPSLSGCKRISPICVA